MLTSSGADTDERSEEMSQLRFKLSSSLIPKLNESIFNNLPIDYFPMLIIIKSTASSVIDLLKEENIWQFCQRYKNNIRVNLTNKNTAERILRRLIENKISFNADYSSFISHPGNLFVKNLSKDLISEKKLYDFFNSTSEFHSLNEINILKSKGSECCAILKFNIHLDCDNLINSLDPLPNPFHVNANVPLYLNRYVDRKERALWSNTDETTSGNKESMDAADSSNNVYDTVMIQNLDSFFKEKVITMGLIEQFIEKLGKFGEIETVCFPLKSNSSETNLKLEGHGYVSFAHSEDINNEILKCLYCLSGKKLDEFMSFKNEDEIDFRYDKNLDDEDGDDEVILPGTVRLSINQYKFNYLLPKSSGKHLYLHSGYSALSIGRINMEHYNYLISRFYLNINYQETNLYVNNLAVLFRNDDDLWESFWGQFGKIKSARIIRSDYYIKPGNGQNFGKIGFIFYKSFRMAIRAILLTNGKQICYNNQFLRIGSSFAIQKSVHSRPQTRGGEQQSSPYYYPRGAYMPAPMAPMHPVAPQMPYRFIPYLPAPIYYMNGMGPFPVSQEYETDFSSSPN